MPFSWLSLPNDSIQNDSILGTISDTFPANNLVSKKLADLSLAASSSGNNESIWARKECLCVRTVNANDVESQEIPPDAGIASDEPTKEDAAVEGIPESESEEPSASAANTDPSKGREWYF